MEFDKRRVILRQAYGSAGMEEKVRNLQLPLGIEERAKKGHRDLLWHPRHVLHRKRTLLQKQQLSECHCWVSSRRWALSHQREDAMARLAQRHQNKVGMYMIPEHWCFSVPFSRKSDGFALFSAFRWQLLTRSNRNQYKLLSGTSGVAVKLIQQYYDLDNPPSLKWDGLYPTLQWLWTFP